jgi:hypothetical protein
MFFFILDKKIFIKIPSFLILAVDHDSNYRPKLATIFTTLQEL